MDTKQIKIRLHAKEQIQKRSTGKVINISTGTVLARVQNVISMDEVYIGIKYFMDDIAKQTNLDEVRVIVKAFSKVITCDDGSNGDCVIACVDPETLTVKTVMLQRSQQVLSKMELEKDVKYYVYTG